MNIKKYRTALLCLFMAPVALSLTGCARPNDEDMTEMLSKAYQCKWVKIDSYKKTDSLPGIWNYIGAYTFDIRFKDEQAGSHQFFKGLYNTAPGETDWQKVLATPKARDYLRDGCAPPAQRILEQVAIKGYEQLQNKNAAKIRLPIAISLKGWAETSSGRGGWEMDMRRDKFDDTRNDKGFIWTEPMSRAAITSKLSK